MPDSKPLSSPKLKGTILGGIVGAAFAVALLIATTPASATPVASDDASYAALDRVFPDPLAGCSIGLPEPCSPNAQGNFPASQFIQFGEFEDALRYMNQKSEWQNYMEVWPLDDGQFPGNTLGSLEFEPDAAFRSAGLPTTTLERKKSDLYVVRVTDESVPDAGKKRYALSLSIHGIERAGAEGGTRAMEDLVTAFTTEKADDPIVPESVDPNAPTFGDVLKKTIIYFTYPNPDGWRRGSATDVVDDSNDGDDATMPGLGGGSIFFQRFNGNGMDVNRDWPDIGYSFRPYSGESEPETRALSSFYKDARDRGGPFAAGDDLHGMPFADALSYTLLPHGRHDFAKDQRIRDAAIKIHENSEQALSWSPIIQPNDAPKGGGAPCSPDVLGEACAQIYGQTWGTVYDTIDYTTTGTLGDWFDSKKGLNADGIDNEMAFSHLDKNIVFDPHTEQLHVDGNKALIYAHLANILNPPTDTTFDAAGRKGYVPNERLRRAAQENQPDDSGRDPQAAIEMEPKAVGDDGRTIYDRSDGFAVEAGNGGMRVEVTEANAAGIAPSYAPNVNQTTLKVECKCPGHQGSADAADPEWTVVSEDYNQKQLYMAAGLTATVNQPEGDTEGKPIEWRMVIEGLHAATKARVEFTRGPASSDGNTGGDAPPKLAAYDVANTDFFADLNDYSRPNEGFEKVDPQKVIAGTQSLDSLDTLTLADGALPGYKGIYGSADAPPPNEDIAIASERPTVPAAHQPEADQELSEPRARIPGSYETVDFEVGAKPDFANKSVTIEIDLPDAPPAGADLDLYLYRVEEDGSETYITHSGSGGPHEVITLGAPTPGTYRAYIDNWSTAPPAAWTGSITFEGYESAAVGGDTGAFSSAEKDQWTAELRDFVEGGGNLVLTDSSLLALPDLAPGISRLDIAKQSVYVGQITFKDGDGDTLDDPLARNVEQPGARFKSGVRRQTFEPTPLGFAIQDPSGAEASTSPQWDVDRGAWEAAGGRYVAGSASSGGAGAQPLTDRVTVGEIKLGKGQIRIAGSLLPQPSNQYDHPLGIEPYATTYTSYVLARNLLDWRNPNRPVDQGSGPGPDDETAGSKLPSSTKPVTAKAKKCAKAKRAKKRAKRKKCKKKKRKKKK